MCWKIMEIRWKIMEILGNSGRRMGNVLENHGNPRKFWEKNGTCAGKSWKSLEILGEEWEMCWKFMEILGNSERRMGNVLENHGNPRKFWEKNGKCAGKSWKS